MSKSKVKKGLLVLITAVMILGMSISMYSLSKNTEILKLLTGTQGDNEDAYRVASFDIAIDGRNDDNVNFCAHATTKLSDIRKIGNEYEPHSFLPGAYQTHTLTVTNNSEATANCLLSVERYYNDDRIFYAVLPDVSEDTIVQSLYTDSDIGTPEKIKDYLDGITFKECVLEKGQTKTFTMIVWSEHDAVFKDENGDGIADESDKFLNQLDGGTPTEKFTMKFSYEQKD